MTGGPKAWATYLERVLESIRLPIRGIVGELDLALEMDMNIVQPRQVQRLANHVSVALGKVEGATMVRLLQALVKSIRDIIFLILGRTDGDLFAVVEGGSLPRMLGSELGNVSWHAGRELDGAHKSPGKEGDNGEDSG